MTNMDENMERIQEEMYQKHHARLNATLGQRLRTRSREEVLENLCTADALAPAGRGEALQGA